MTRSPARILKRCSLCSTVAIATSLVIGPSPAAAQSFEANIIPPVTTNGAVVTTSPGITDIALNGGQTVIDWTPNDTAVSGSGIGFQYGGTATFHSANDFAVLNRINPVDPTRLISMDGTIQSLVGGQTGGSVFFYSPAGIVLGPNAVINVGSLVLTTSPIEVAGGQFLTGVDGTTVTFGNANPSSSVFTNPGSTINALNQNSYVAMVSPRVEHHGTINVNGVAALVAAEAATINFRMGGLFDIQIDTGTTDSEGVAVGSTGVITGPASTGFGDNHRAYLVAVPKNTLLTMAIASGADLGFEIAGAADVVGNAVVLSAGHNIEFGSTSFEASPASGALANINLNNNNFTSALYGRASGEAIVGATAGGSATFASDVSLRAGTKVAFSSGNPGSSVTVGGNLTLSANAEGANEGDSATAGRVELQAFNGGTLSVAGSTTLTAVGTGGFGSTTGLASGDGTGGTILVQSTSSGNMSLGDSTFDTFSADASGRGGSISGLADGGDGLGGTVNVFTSGGSSMSVAGSASVAANGRAASTVECFTCGGTAGIGDGGTITVQAHTGPDNVMAFAQSLSMNANGEGGVAQTGNGGAGLGGDIIFSSLGQSNVTVGGDLSISAYGQGGNAGGVGGDGGAGTGGDATASGDNGSIDIGGSFDAYLAGTGGDSEFGNGGYGEGGFGQLFANNNASVSVGLYSSIYTPGNGGSGLASGAEGQGGSAYFSSSGGATLDLGVFAQLYADGQGGEAFDGDGAGGNGGLGEGGHVEAYANDATLDVQGSLWLSADGEGGGAGGLRDAGDSLGGDVYLQAIAGGTLTVAGGLYASAVGMGDYINSTTNSGDATGGFIGIYARDGDSTLTVSGAADLNADGQANRQGECFPCGGVGGIGDGGEIIIASQGATGLNGNVLTFEGTLLATANAYGGGGVGGAAGDGVGGDVTLNAADGNKANVVGALEMEAIGSGGFGTNGFAGGDGTGGLARITTSGSGANLLTLSSDVSVDASGYGGDSELSLGGNGQSGGARVVSNDGGIVVSGDLELRSISSGGRGDNGGDGIAFIGANPQNTATSDARLIAYGGSINVVGITTLDVTASGGSGANGGSGGDASGGYAVIHARNSNLGPSTITLGTVIIDADAIGGSGGAGLSGNEGTPGGDGGSATGGFVVVTAAAGNGHVNAGNVALSASASGGDGGDGGNGDGLAGGNGGAGGSATGGTIFAGAEAGLGEATGSNLGTANLGSVIAFADATGGNGGFGNFGTPGGNGGAGGSGDGGLAVLQTLGATVTVGSVGLTADGTGGDGGGSETGLSGVGGDGFAGEVGVIATSRFLTPPQRGTLNAGAIIASATGTGGFGSTQGDSLVEGGSVFQVENANANIGSVEILVSGGSVSPGADESRITVINGSVNVTGNFAFSTIGELSVHLANNGQSTSLTAGNVILAATDFVSDSINSEPGNPGTIFADNFAVVTGNNLIADANIEAVDDMVIAVPGAIRFDKAISDGAVDLWAQGSSITIEEVNAGTSLNLLAATSVGTDDILAGTTVTIEAQGGSFGAGHIVAGGDVSLIAATSMEGDDITTPGNIFAQTFGGDVDFENLTGLDVTLDSSNAIVLTGNVDAGGDVDFNAGGSLSAGAIDAQSIEASAGGIATLNGVWAAQNVTLTSDDIDIAATGGIEGAASGIVTLISTNTTQALIGDGMTGTGYALSNAEFGRIEGGSVYILANGDASAAQDMLIGDLTVTGPSAGSTIENGEGILVFAVGDVGSESVGGVIRVVGDVSATGFGLDNYMEFYADRFELDAATGSISITSSGSALSGELGLYADQIHVAEGSILDQLALDPQYDGYQEDLNAPAAVQRPEGVLNAASIWIESDNLQNILIQNTGTSDTPAGFLAEWIFVNDDEEVAGPPGSIDVVVNGQLETEGGRLIKIAVRDALVDGEDLTPFTANSTINGCLLTGGDCVVVPEPEGPGIDPVRGISSEIVLISEDMLDEQPFGNEPIINNDEDDETSSPIQPPAPLFDTRPLNPDADIDEPISGSGNPALIGAGPVDSGDQQ